MLRSLILIPLFLLPAWLRAAPLTWEDCVRMTAENNKELLAQKAIVEAARLRRSGAASGFFPEISANMGYSRTDQRTPSPALNEGYSANLVLAHNLFAGFSDSSKLDWHDANLRAAERELTILKARISKDLKNAFQSFLFAKASIELRKTIVKRRQDNVRLVELRFRGGRENRGSVLLSQANLSDSKYEQNQAELWVRQNKITLAKVLGLENPEELDIVGNIPVATPPPPTLKLGEIARGTPQVALAAERLSVVEAGLGIARSAFFPKLSLSAGINSTDSRFFPDTNQQWTLGLNLNIPLFNGGRDYFETRAQNQAVLTAAHQRDQALRETLDKLETALSNYLQAVERVQVNANFVAAATARAEIGRMRYNNGLISFEDWYGIENELIDRQKKELDSKRDRVLFEAAWEEAQGVGILP